MALILFTSCIEEPTEKFETPQQHPKLAIVKDWFETHKEELRIDDSRENFSLGGHELILPFFEKEPDWDKFHIYEWPDGRTVYEINLANKEMVLSSEFRENMPQADPRETVIQNIMFVENRENGRYDPVIARYYPADEYSISAFDEISYNKIGAGWSGKVDIWTYDERYFIGFVIEDGVIVSTAHPQWYMNDQNARKLPNTGEITLTTCILRETVIATTVSTSTGSTTTYHVESSIWYCPSGGGGDSIGSPYTVGGGATYEWPSESWSGGDGSGSSGTVSDGRYVVPAIKVPEITITLTDVFRKNTNLRCLYNKLRENSYFESMASKFEGVSPDVHLTLDLASFNKQFNGKAQWQGTGKPIIITINSANLGNRSALEVARTIIHEMFHAEFYRAVNSNMPTSGDILFRDTFDQYVKMYMGTADQHHNLMADRYLDVMADILADIHKKLDYVAFAHAMKDVYPNGIPKSFYKSLAWEGLKDTRAYRVMEKITVQPPLKSPLQKVKEAKEFARYGLKNCN